VILREEVGMANNQESDLPKEKWRRVPARKPDETQRVESAYFYGMAIAF
jgi:hypothetical protein